MKIAGQLLAYSLFFALVAAFSSRPALQLLAKDQSVISLSFSHAAQRIGQCTRLSQEELNALPPNMRTPDSCPRERHPLHIELRIDAATLYSATLQPSGIHSDGKATVYERLRVASGVHTITVEMNDSGTVNSYDYSASKQVNLRPAQNLVVYFDSDNRRFVFE